MKKFAVSLVSTALLSSVVFAANANADEASVAPSFDYASVAYSEMEQSSSEATFSGFRGQFSRSLSDVLFVRGDYESVSRDGATYEETEVSLGARYMIDERSSIYAGAGFLNAYSSDASGSNLDHLVFTGVAIRPSEAFELRVELQRARVYRENESRAEVGVRYYAAPRFSVDASYGFTNQNTDAMRLGVSFHF
ncbi:hypothetical protein [Aliidiomarina indica]|uniref:hypothetical protein n=1 Tax=Aliidiomarina indica TaxID=2749147 RepID=UPI001890316C|nr:hypothetical protein [Aliidiomarina indica]